MFYNLFRVIQGLLTDTLPPIIYDVTYSNIIFSYGNNLALSAVERVYFKNFIFSGEKKTSMIKYKKKSTVSILQFCNL